MKVIDARKHEGKLELSCEVVVVGSGAGGAVVATLLAEAGVDVIILEEGRYVPSERYAEYSTLESLGQLFRGGGTTFAMGLGKTPMINVTMGKCVGGSSVLTGGVCFRTPEKVTSRWAGELGLSSLSSERLEPHFEAVARAVHMEEVPETMRSRSTELFARGASARGVAIKSLSRNTEGCRGCGRCNFGCPHQAKRSVDLSFLPRAVEAGARLYSGCRVDSVVSDLKSAKGVSGWTLGGKADAPRGKLLVSAKRVVLSAGAAHTPLILKASGLKSLSRQIGRNLTLHPAFRVMARFDEEVRGWSGALQSAYSDAFENQNFTLVGLFLPPGVLAATLPGVGREHRAYAEMIPQLSVFGGLIHDQGGGRVRRGLSREPLLTYRMAKEDRAVIPRLLREMGEIYFAAGAKQLFLPVLGLGPVDADAFRRLDLERLKMRDLECSSQHPLGSCRMGQDATQGVVDEDGNVFGLRGLSIADGSVVPTSLGVNPQLTVMALAHKIGARLRET